MTDLPVGLDTIYGEYGRLSMYGYALVHFEKVRKNGKCWRGEGDGVIVARGRVKSMHAKRKELGGNGAGYFVFFTSRGLGEVIRMIPPEEATEDVGGLG